MPSMRDLIETVNLFEMPLASYDIHGDFSQEGSHRAKDRKLLASPKAKERLTKLLRTGGFDIAVHAVNLSHDQLNGSPIINPTPDRGRDTADTEDGNFVSLGGEGNDIAGAYSEAELRQHFGLTIKANPNAINFVVAGNAAGDHALSAWMIIHRLTHMVEDAATSGSGRISSELADAWFVLNQTAQRRLTYYEKNANGDIVTRTIWYKNLGTMKSASDPGQEVSNEFLVQYLATGKTPLRRDIKDGPTEEALRSFEVAMMNACHDVAEGMVGKIFFSF